MSVDNLIEAARNGNANEVTRLLNNGVDVNGFHSSWGDTALMRASICGHEAVVRLLLSRGANVNLARRSDGLTALIYACFGGHVSVAELLLRSGADHTLKDKSGKTALEYCGDSAKRAQIQAVINSLAVSTTPSAPQPPPPTASTPAPTPAPTPVPTAAPPTPIITTAANATTMEQLRVQLASMTSQLADRTREKESLNTQLQSRTTERDLIAQERDAAVADRTRVTAEKTQVISQRDSLQTQLAERTREKEALSTQLVDRTGERDRLTSQLAQRTIERDARTSERDAALAQLSARTNERDQLAQERTQLTTQLTDMTRERDSLVQQLEAARAAAGTGGGAVSGSSSAFERYRPHMFVPSLVPCCRNPGIHDVSEDSALFRTCSSLCNTGGNWFPTAGPIAGFRLVAVQAVVHEEAYYIGYENKLRRITQQRQNGGDYFNSNTGSMNASQLLVLSALRDQFLERAPGTVSKGANSFYCYHGPRAEHVGSICSTGMVATGAMDAGFFGCGCYTTLNMEYAARYARGDFDANGGPRGAPGSRYPIIMFAAMTGMAYPVTPAGPHGAGDYGHPDSTAPLGSSDFYGRPLKRGFDCHVVCVSQASNWQAVERNQCQYVEVVIEQEAQLLPVAVLWFEDLNRF